MPAFYKTEDGRHIMHGVAGRFTKQTTRSGKGINPALWFNQEWISETREWDETPTRRRWTRVEIRFDDNCGNGFNSFAVTGTGGPCESEKAGKYFRRKSDCGGCMHEEIARVFPELAPLIRYHLYDTRGPMHYPANPVFLAGNRDCWGKAPGEVSGWETRLKFAGVPITHKVPSAFRKWLQDPAHVGPYTLQPIDHKKKPGESYDFAPKWSLRDAAGVCFGERWHECPFDSEREAWEFREAFDTCSPEWVKFPTGKSKGKERELDAARSCADWPEATDEELSVSPDELKAALLARLPDMLARFESAVRGAGFFWTPQDTVGAAGEWKG